LPTGRAAPQGFLQTVRFPAPVGPARQPNSRESLSPAQRGPGLDHVGRAVNHTTTTLAVAGM
ncbi:hypothetical protein BAE44_0018242, partial [Dichanthelium oligosanthes]